MWLDLGHWQEFQYLASDLNAILDFISGTDAKILSKQDTDAFKFLVSDLNAILDFVGGTDAKTQLAQDSDAIYLSVLAYVFTDISVHLPSKEFQ